MCVQCVELRMCWENCGAVAGGREGGNYCRENERIYTLDTTMFIYIYIYTLIIKPTRCTNFSNLFSNKTLHVSDSSSVHHQEFFTVHTAMVYVIQVC